MILVGARTGIGQRQSPQGKKWCGTKTGPSRGTRGASVAS